MSAALLPDAERILTGFLVGAPEVAALVADRVFATLPAAPVFPALRLTRWGGIPNPGAPLWLDNADVQVDAWADTKAEARTLAETVRAVLADRLVGDYGDLGVVARVAFGLLAYRPDPEFAPARPRYVFDLTVTGHPAR